MPTWVIFEKRLDRRKPAMRASDRYGLYPGAGARAQDQLQPAHRFALFCELLQVFVSNYIGTHGIQCHLIHRRASKQYRTRKLWPIQSCMFRILRTKRRILPEIEANTQQYGQFMYT